MATWRALDTSIRRINSMTKCGRRRWCRRRRYEKRRGRQRQIGSITTATWTPTMMRTTMTPTREANDGMTTTNDVDELHWRTATTTTTIKTTTTIMRTMITMMTIIHMVDDPGRLWLMTTNGGQRQRIDDDQDVNDKDDDDNNYVDLT